MSNRTTTWRTLAHHAALPPPDWHARLCERLGERPRRLGTWAELALYGARQCLDAAHEDTLAPGALLWVASLRGPVAATRAGIEQLRSGSPMPFTFLQTQPGQMLAGLCRHLRWQGDARFALSRDAQALLHLAQREAGPAGLLLGWVDEGEALRSEWWRLVPGEVR
jgi:hypothetical protein